jgi:hypothetical protein
VTTISSFTAALVIALVSVAAIAQDKKAMLPPVTVTQRQSVEKSYRKMLRGMDLFERRHALAPNAQLRFKLLPRKRDTDMDHIMLEIIGDTFEMQVPVAADHTFTLQRDQKALAEDAIVTPNRRKLSMTWRTDIRSPGLPPNARRLGDLRLECEAGIEADLVSNSRNIVGLIANALSDAFGYCGRKDAKYLFFADRPLFGVTLVAPGGRRESLPIDKLYAEASDDPGLQEDLPYCDCEVLVDRTYFLPLGDKSWPDDTLVEFEYMDD